MSPEPSNLDLNATLKKYELVDKVIDYIGRVGLVAVWAIPLTPVVFALKYVSGEETYISVNIGVTALASFGAGGVIFGLLYRVKSYRQSKDIARMRQRMTFLEGKNAALEEQLEKFRRHHA